MKESKTKKAVSFTFLFEKKKSKTKEKGCSYSALFFYSLPTLLSFAVKESKTKKTVSLVFFLEKRKQDKEIQNARLKAVCFDSFSGFCYLFVFVSAFFAFFSHFSLNFRKNAVYFTTVQKVKNINHNKEYFYERLLSENFCFFVIFDSGRGGGRLPR